MMPSPKVQRLRTVMRGVLLACAMLACLCAYALWCSVRLAEISVCASSGGFWLGSRCEVPSFEIVLPAPAPAKPAPQRYGPAL